MRRSILSLHAANVLLPAFLLVVVDGALFQVPLAIGLFFALFTLMHDAMHGALGLSRRANDWVLSVAGVLVGASGHTTRWFHLRHHARPLAEDDLEGRGATLPLALALVEAPRAYLTLAWRGWRRFRPEERRLAIAEWFMVLAFVAVAAWCPAMRLYLAVVVLAQLTIPLWASRVPHHPPAVLMALAQKLVWTRSPLVLGLVFHAAHHRRPRIGTYHWPAREFEELAQEDLSAVCLRSAGQPA